MVDGEDTSMAEEVDGVKSSAVSRSGSASMADATVSASGSSNSANLPLTFTTLTKMANGHARSPSVDASETRTTKKAKTTHGNDVPTLAERLDPTPRFATGLLEENSIQALHDKYKTSGPYLHAVVDKLFQDDLLASVKDELIGQLCFTEKETDIYKVCAIEKHPRICAATTL